MDNPSQTAAPLGELQQIDACCDRFEAAWRLSQSAQKGQYPRLADFLEAVAPELRAQLLPELLAIELEYRRDSSGRPLSAAELAEIHPELAAALGDELRGLATLQDNRTVSPTDVTLPILRQPTPTPSGSGGVHIRCPHCQCAVELLDETKLDEVTCDACGSSFSLVGAEDSPELAGRRTVGRFKLIERIGMGGFGAVWRARDAELDREVAVKIPRRGQLDPREAELFFREARAAAQLKHPHIVPVHEVGRDGEAIYIVSDLIRGESLAEWLKARRPGPRKTAELLATVADALHFAHEHGIVHRDLKPSNLMIDAAGAPHLMDFGLAKRDVGEISMTLDGQVLGTPAYMSPEQAGGEVRWVDRRTDLYSLGVILFQMLCAELPFRGSAQRQMQQRLTDDPPSPKSLNPRTPLDLATICLKCLERDPNRRYRTGEEVAAELRRYLRGEPIHARPLSRVARLARWARREPWKALAAGLTVLLAIAGPTAAVLLETQRAELQSQRNTLFQKDQENTKLIAENERQLDQRAAAIAELREELAGLKGERPGVERIVPDWKRNMIRDFLAARETALASASGPDAIYAHLALAYLQLELDAPDKAKQHLATAAGLVANAEPALRAEVMTEQAALGEAPHSQVVRLRRDIAAAKPEDVVAQIELFGALLDQPSELLTLREELKSLWPSDPRAAYELARYLTMRGKL